MENEKNIILKHKSWIITLFSAFIIFMFFYVKNSMGTFFDIPTMFLSYIEPLIDPNKHGHFCMFIDNNKVRLFNNFLVALPFNTWFLVAKNSSILNMLRVYSVSYFVVPFFLLILNFLAAKRTKRYDIAILAFAFYFILSIPNAIWAVKEFHITFLVYFIILSYFLSKVKLDFKDLIPITILIIYLFESSGITFIFGILLFVFAQLYAKKEDTLNPWFNVLIGYGGILAVVYISIKMFVLKYFVGNIHLLSRFQEYLFALKTTLEKLFDGVLLIPLFALPLIVFIVFYKKDFGRKSFCIGALYIALMLFVINYKNHFFPDTNTELLNYSISLLFIFPLVFAILLFDYLKIDLNKFNPSFYSNLIIVTCVFGILNLAWQVNTSFYFKKSENYMKNLIANSSIAVINIPQEDIKKYRFLETNTCFGQTQRSVLYNIGNENTKIIMPTKDNLDYSQFCFIDKEHTYYQEGNDFIFLQSNKIRIKSKYWDLHDAAEEFQKSGLTKDINMDN